MNPAEVKPKNFREVEIVYTSQDGKFTIASGFGNGSNEYGDEMRLYAIRWNGPEDKLGFPTSNGRPIWFQLPVEIDENVIGTIIGSLEKQRKKADSLNQL